MRYAILWPLGKLIYKNFVRFYIKKAVESTDNEFDDLILKACDKIFEFEKGAWSYE